MSDPGQYYRNQALAAERRLLETKDPEHQEEWSRIAFAWHMLAGQVAREPSDIEIIPYPDASSQPK